MPGTWEKHQNWYDDVTFRAVAEPTSDQIEFLAKMKAIIMLDPIGSWAQDVHGRYTIYYTNSDDHGGGIRQIKSK